MTSTKVSAVTTKGIGHQLSRPGQPHIWGDAFCWRSFETLSSAVRIYERDGSSWDLARD
jgi:hypothetical protein